MIPYHEQDGVTLYHGDVLAVLREIPNGVVNCCVTSPPYWGLRDYGTARWEEGDPACQHSVGGQVQDTKAPGAITTGQRPGVDASRCRKCGAVRIDAQLGLEPTPEAYVSRMVEVFREARRVLRDDGTLWLNVGDSYAAARGGTHRPAETLAGGVSGISADGYRTNRGRGDCYTPSRNAGLIGLKHKDLVGIPWRLAFALQSDGWYLRSDIIWAKPNPMPESVTDRPTKAHEYLFLLSKSQRYWYDAEAISEPCGPFHAGGKGNALDNPKTPSSHKKQDALGKNTYTGFNERWRNNPTATKNRRSVWVIPTRPYAGAHFAVMPTALVTPCIKAGCPTGGTVLDPFIGSGTVAVVARQLGTNAIGIDLNQKYLDLAINRIHTSTHAPSNRRRAVGTRGASQPGLFWDEESAS